MSVPARQVLILLLSYATLAVAWGWRLHAADRMPDKGQELLAATRAQMAVRLAHTPAHLQRPALFQLALLPDRELHALHDWSACSAEQRLRQLTVQTGPVATPCPLNTALLFSELTRPDVLPPDDTRLLISAAGDRLEEPHKVAALELLAGQATAAGNFNVALEIQLRIAESPAVAWRHVLALADAARLARRPAAALRVLGIWLDPQAGRLDPAHREKALDLQSTLLLEGGRHAEASRLTLEALRAVPANQPVPLSLLERALLATQAADESAELLPWLERHLRTFPEHRITNEEIAAGKALSPAYLRWLRESASIADRKKQTLGACDGYFRLAAAGDLRVLARLHTLATEMGLGAELAKLLPALEKRFGTCPVAQALADGGAPAPAHDLLIARLESHSDDREAWRLLTQLDTASRPHASAPGLWESFLRRFPDDVLALRQLASLQLESGQLPQALRTLQQIPAEQLDEPMLRHIAALAIQLDDMAAAHRAQHLLVERTPAPAMGDVVLLAQLTRQHADADSQAALASAVAKLPAQSAFPQSLLPSTTTGEAMHFNTAAQASGR